MFSWGVATSRTWSGLFCVALLLLCCCAESRAATPYDGSQMPELLTQASCYAGSGSSAGGFPRISSQEFSQRFSSCDTLGTFESNSVYWIRFRADLLPARAVLGLENAASGSLALFLPGKPETNYITIMSSETDAPVSPFFSLSGSASAYRPDAIFRQSGRAGFCLPANPLRSGAGRRHARFQRRCIQPPYLALCAGSWPGPRARSPQLWASRFTAGWCNGPNCNS